MSIRAKILFSLCIVILLMGTTNAVLMLQMLNYSRQYDAIITNITTANSISGYIKPDIDTEMWNIVAGKTEFAQGKQYEIINGRERQIAVDDGPRRLLPESKIKLEVINRTMQTLTHYVDLMGEQIAHGSTVAENEAVLENIRAFRPWLRKWFRIMCCSRCNQADRQYQRMREGFTRWEIFYLVLMFAAIGFAVVAAWGISRSIYIPIKKLHDVTTTITKNDLQALVTRDNVDEITELGMSFNIMIGKIRELLDPKSRNRRI